MRRIISTLSVTLFLCLFFLVGIKSDVYAWKACAPKNFSSSYYCEIDPYDPERTVCNIDSSSSNYDANTANYCCGIINGSQSACDEYCFLPGTMVKSGSGEKTIEEIKVGDRVTSFVDNKITESKVSQIFKKKRDYYYSLIAGDYSVKASAEHPFYVGDNKYTKISELKKGDTVYVLFTQRPPSSLRTRRSGKIIPFTNKKEIAMKKLLIILLCAALTACSSNNVNTPTFTQPSSTPIKAPETETKMPTQEAIPTPEAVVTEGSDANKAGIRVGATAKENPDGSYTYTFANPANDRTIEDVGTAKIVDGKLVFEKAEFLNQQIPTCGDMQAKMKENQVNKKDLLDGIEKWDISKVEGDGVNIPDVILNALVNDETPFPEGVLTGQKLDSRDYSTPDGSIQIRYMIWDRDVQNIMDANPDKRPYIQLGCVPVVTSTEIQTVDKDGKTTIKQVVETSIAVITKWLNPDKSQVVVVTYVPVNYFLSYPPSDFVFNVRTTGITKDSPNKFGAKIAANPEKFRILKQWNETGIVSKEVEVNGSFFGVGPEKNLH